MTDNLSTELDRTAVPTPEAQADALAYLTRTGNGDLAEVLGLVEPPPEPVAPGECGLCGNPLPKHGVCRKRIVCRAAAAEQAGKQRAEQDRAVDQLLDAVLAEAEPVAEVSA
jgi:hypothetical protein